jgi:hypothetical protein
VQPVSRPATARVAPAVMSSLRLIRVASMYFLLGSEMQYLIANEEVRWRFPRQPVG